jgi:hypothetical protein
MTPSSFVDRVKKHFGYLESEYDFRIVHESVYDVRSETDGTVEYQSHNICVLIDSETGFVTLRFYRVKDGKDFYLTPIDVNEFLNTNEKEKKILLSMNPEDKLAATALFDEKFLLNQPGWKGSRGTVDDVNRELQNFANWLKKHADIWLKDDSLLWTKLYEYKIQRARADQLRRGEDEFIYVRMKDANGKFRLIQQSIFHDDLQYIDKLKREFEDK